MKRLPLFCVSLALMSAAWVCASEIPQTAQQPEQQKVFAPMAAEQVKQRVWKWVKTLPSAPDQKKLKQLEQWWQWKEPKAAPTAEELLNKSVQTFALLNPTVASVVKDCRFDQPVPKAPDTGRLDNANLPPFVIANVRLFVARFLTQASLYDEALAEFVRIDPDQVIDPATLFFYRAVCEHQLLKKDEALKTLNQLLDQTVAVPERYASVARLMKYDLEQFRGDDLDEIARKMLDVKRRLALGRGGRTVQQKEKEIVDALDKLIKKIEEQANKSSCNCAGGAGGENSNQSNGPADDSVVKGATAPGRVDKKDIGHKAGWGNLPPKQATRAKNLINRHFPAHYKRAIDQYFKKLANRKAPTNSSNSK